MIKNQSKCTNNWTSNIIRHLQKGMYNSTSAIHSYFPNGYPSLSSCCCSCFVFSISLRQIHKTGLAPGSIFTTSVHTGGHSVRACSMISCGISLFNLPRGILLQISNRFNVARVEILLPRINCADEIVGKNGLNLLLERTPGAKPRSKTPRV